MRQGPLGASLIHAIVLFTLVGGPLGAKAETADGLTVDDGALISNCLDDKELQLAVAAGGVHRFECSGTIQLSKTLEVSKDLTLDGNGNKVVLEAPKIRVPGAPGEPTLARVLEVSARTVTI